MFAITVLHSKDQYPSLFSTPSYCIFVKQTYSVLIILFFSIRNQLLEGESHGVLSIANESSFSRASRENEGVVDAQPSENKSYKKKRFMCTLAQ